MIKLSFTERLNRSKLLIDLSIRHDSENLNKLLRSDLFFDEDKDFILFNIGNGSLKKACKALLDSYHRKFRPEEDEVTHYED